MVGTSLEKPYGNELCTIALFKVFFGVRIDGHHA